MPRKRVTNWGNFPVITANFSEPSNTNELRDIVLQNNNVIARGNGRCYGDSSLGENIISTLKLNHFLYFDQSEGLLECESGVLLSDILDVVVPKGFFLPVTPGTKYITLGGAVAADIHGKNHHREGSFSDHVISLQILTSDGEIVECSSTDRRDLFWQTCGGMGLTGMILKVKFRLKPTETAYIRQVSHKARDIDAAMSLFDKSADSTYSVAWIDCLAPGKSLGRSILMLGEHATRRELPARLESDPLCPARPSRLAMPFFLPAFSLNHASVKLFNAAYYYRQLAATRAGLVHFDPYFYPLDGIRNWNRIYGRDGFVQYQFVLPKENSYEGLKEILERIGDSGQGSPLAVLKLFGRANPNAVMSFPREGYTLALDFKVTPAVFRLLDGLDEIVLKYGGRLYLAKDARMSAAVFRKSYSNVVHSNRFRSSQAVRLEY